ncbi:dienelactone hydrolase family protein [Mumia zhuanghuii]|uniref:Dienelactone hydrolase family protein n=1 Tax=Mumia zhuanghuii TaxID=2585211 RepID=A0A5C4MWA2_9ACTN|nr:dienelactone hydrolase family protein [Mumia zhuanghuii]TNC40986.1 dienelactone hydrolase family protein [Mumia zhuanghuii]TNC49270.1 dienelactone hydrolase family protein [Mumia zhuanghuii]
MPEVDLSSTDVPDTSPRLRGYLAEPSTPGPWPGVVLVHEAFGLDDNMRRHADRLAGMGYATLAVDLYSDGGARRCLVATYRSFLSGKGRAFSDIDAARQWLVDRTDTTDKVGVIGFCLGGGFALLVAGRGGYDAAGVNYGLIPKDLDDVVAASCPVVASYGSKDRVVRDGPAQLETALTAAGIEHEVTVYDGAGHGFLNESEGGPRAIQPVLRVTGIGPDSKAASQAWERIGAFFAEHLR